MIKIEKKLLHHLRSGEKTLARSVVLTQLDTDRFRASMTIAHDKESLLKINELFEQDIEIDTIRSQDHWNRTYWTQMNVELSHNFSKMKLSHVIDVMTFLREKGDPKFTPKQENRSVKSKKNRVNNSISQRTEIIKEKGYIEKAVVIGLGAASGAAIGAKVIKGGMVATPIINGSTITGIASPVLKGATIGGIFGAVAGAAIVYIIHSKKQEKYNDKSN